MSKKSEINRYLIFPEFPGRISFQSRGAEYPMRILFIEDNEGILENLFEYFELKGHTLDAARDGVSGLHLATTESYDCIVLDIMLPRIDGLTLCRKLRKELYIDTPIVMLTAKNTLEDTLAGFDAGADDYLVKPFALAELEVRLSALIRRVRGEVSHKLLQVHDLVFDREKSEVRRAGNRLSLNRIGRSILALLMQESPRVVSRAKIESHIWGDAPPDTDTLRTHMYNVRNVIDRPFETKLLKTLPKEGYRLAYDDDHS